MGLTVLDAGGQPQARLLVLDRATGAVRQRLDLGAGRLTGLSRVAESLYAVVEDDPRGLRRFAGARLAVPRMRPDRHPLGASPRFRVVRIVGAR